MIKTVERTVNGTTYKMALTSRATVEVENKLGSIVKYMQSVTDGALKLEDMAVITSASMKVFDETATIDTAFNLFDELADEGGIFKAAFGVITDLFKAAGYIPESKDNKKSKPSKN